MLVIELGKDKQSLDGPLKKYQACKGCGEPGCCVCVCYWVMMLINEAWKLASSFCMVIDLNEAENLATSELTLPGGVKYFCIPEWLIAAAIFEWYVR